MPSSNAISLDPQQENQGDFLSENGIILCAAAEVEALLRRGEDVLMEREALKHYIISAWLDRDRTGLTASRALDWLHGQDLLDDETLMLGFSAACTAATALAKGL